MDNELGKSGKFVLSSLAISAAALQFFYAFVPHETDRKVGELYQPFGIIMSIVFLSFGLFIWYRSISRRAAILLFFGLFIVDIVGPILIRAFVGSGA